MVSIHLLVCSTLWIFIMSAVLLLISCEFLLLLSSLGMMEGAAGDADTILSDSDERRGDSLGPRPMTDSHPSFSFSPPPSTPPRALDPDNRVQGTGTS